MGLNAGIEGFAGNQLTICNDYASHPVIPSERSDEGSYARDK